LHPQRLATAGRQALAACDHEALEAIGAVVAIAAEDHEAAAAQADVLVEADAGTISDALPLPLR